MEGGLCQFALAAVKFALAGQQAAAQWSFQYLVVEPTFLELVSFRHQYLLNQVGVIDLENGLWPQTVIHHVAILTLHLHQKTELVTPKIE
jgi:hypothetical protein